MTVVTEVVIMTSFSKKHLNTLTTDHSQGSYSQLLRCLKKEKERKSATCLVRNVDVWGPDSVTEPVLSLQTQLVVAGQVGVTESRVLPPKEDFLTDPV